MPVTEGDPAREGNSLDEIGRETSRPRTGRVCAPNQQEVATEDGDSMPINVPLRLRSGVSEGGMR